MKLTKNIFLISSLLVLAGCAEEDMFQKDLGGKPGDGVAKFSISTVGSEIGIITRADGEEEKLAISELKWLVADKNGKILPHYYGRLDNQNTQLTIEGLSYGDYTLLCLATLDDAEGISFSNPESIADSWLINDKDNGPLDGIYCYKKVHFSLGAEGVASNVILEHIAAKVSIDIEMPNPSQWRHIKRVSVSLNEEIPTSLNADGSYSGSQIVDAYDIYDPSGVFTFTTLPSEQPVSGYVEIQSSRDNGDDIIQTYEFSDLLLEAGKIAHISLDYRHPEMESGLLYVATQEQWRYEIGTMFLEEEPKEIFYDYTQRGFYTCTPLQVWIADDGRLGIRYFSPYSLKDLKVKACFNKVSPEWVDLAEFEVINPFEEAFFTLPITQHDCVFDGESGRKVKIPAIPDLSPGEVALKLEWDKEDAFMNKISEIKLDWFIRFSGYGADNGHAYWRHMNPLLCRLAIGLAYDMTYMFSSEVFPEEFKNWEGTLVDSGRIITLEEVQQRLSNQGGLLMGTVVGVLGLGGGQTFGMSADRYYNFYPDTTPVGGNTFNGARQTVFHEFAHCLGYGHDGNMTYGEAWTVLCSKVLVELGWAERLPVSNLTDVTSLPME